jgi:hypothetical protein
LENLGCILENKQKGQMFCFYYAILMNEILLSLGIKSRIIECFPKIFDHDCHMAVIVFIPELNEWAFFDPTFNTYFIDDEGKPLAIDKIRNIYKNMMETKKVPRFIPIGIEKKWELVLAGNRYETYDEWYAIYMLKNIFRFLSPLKSTFGYNIKRDEINLMLNPVGYHIINEYDSFNYGRIIYTNNMQMFIS